MAGPGETGANGGKWASQIVTWGLTAIAAGAFAWGGSEFRDLVAEVKAVRSDIATITTRVSVVESERSREKIDKLDERVRALEGRLR